MFIICIMTEEQIYHPQVICLYYLVCLVAIVVLPHPVFLLCTFVMLLVGRVLREGTKKVLKSLLGYIPLLVLVTVINPLVNHRGPTTLFFIGDMRITLESTLYGFQMGLMVITCICLFVEFSREMTSDRVMMVCGKRFPSLALVLSMMLRLVPIVSRDARELYKLHGTGVRPLGALLSMTMEDGVIRSISMTDRGYNISENVKRTSFYSKPYKKRDIILAIVAVLFLIGVIVASISGFIYARYFPSLMIKIPPVWSVIIWCMYYVFSTHYSHEYHRSDTDT